MSKGHTKSELFTYLAEKTELKSADIKRVFEHLFNFVESELKKGNVVTVPDLCKIRTHTKPATKARKMISPFTKEEITVKAKPARKVIKIKPVKKVKDLV